MSATNLFLVTGRIGKIETTNRNGSALCRVNVATNRWWYGEDGNRQEATDWHSITFWGKAAEAAERNLAVGDLVTVQGTIRPWSQEKDGERRYGINLRAEKFERLLRANGGGAGEADEPSGETAEADGPDGPDGGEYEDIPF